MASAIVSVDLHDAGWETASRLVLAIAVAAWARACATGDVAGRVTGVAATAALGSGLAVLGWRPIVWASLAVAGAIWVGQLPAILGPRGRSGSVFLGTVATQSLAILAASLGLRAVASALLVGGLVLYVLALRQFEPRELLRGSGDHWIAGGALAISTLAGAELDARLVAIVLWACAAAWLPVLAIGELLRPRLTGGPARWSTAFPVGMYAAMSFAVARLGVGWLARPARAWTVVATVVWALVLISAARGARRPAGGGSLARRG